MNTLDYIIDSENNSRNYKDLLIVSMTSYPKRIDNVKPVIDSLLENTIFPDKIVINLAIDEFPNHMDDLPGDLKNFVEEYKHLVEINWVKNNTKVWKKSIPTLYKYPNSSVICIDDDFIYPEDFIETFKRMHKSSPDTPLVGIEWKNNDHNQHCGCSSLDRLEWIEPYLSKINQEIYDLGDEDTFFTYIYGLAGKEMTYVGKKYHLNMKSFNSHDGYSDAHMINPIANYQKYKELLK